MPRLPRQEVPLANAAKPRAVRRRDRRHARQAVQDPPVRREVRQVPPLRRNRTPRTLGADRASGRQDRPRAVHRMPRDRHRPMPEVPEDGIRPMRQVQERPKQEARMAPCRGEVVQPQVDQVDLVAQEVQIPRVFPISHGGVPCSVPPVRRAGPSGPAPPFPWSWPP